MTISETFQQIIGNVENPFDYTNGRPIKQRHGGWTAVNINKHVLVKQDSNEPKSEQEQIFPNEKYIDLEKNENNSRKYTYNAITIIDDERIINSKKKIIELESQLKAEKEIGSKLFNNSVKINDSIWKVIEELSQLVGDWEKQEKNILNELTQKIDIDELRKYVFLKDKKIEKEKELEYLNKEKIINQTDRNLNNLLIKELEENIAMINRKLTKFNDELKETKKITSLKNKITKLNHKLLKTTNKPENLNIFTNIFNNIAVLEKEIQKEINSNNKKVKKIYEEILPINDSVYFITTLVHADQSISEEVMYFLEDKNKDIYVINQIRNYQGIDEYKAKTVLIQEHLNENISLNRTPIKEFLLNLETKKLKIYKTEWIIFSSILLISLILVTLPFVIPIFIPVLATLVVEKSILSIIGVTLAWIVNRGIWTLAADKTKKIEALIKNKFFSLIRKIPFVNKRSVGKTREEEESKKRIKELIANLNHEKLETKLKTQFDIAKEVLNSKKDKKISKLLISTGEMKIENDECLKDEVNDNPDIQSILSIKDTVNSIQNEPSTSTKTGLVRNLI